MAQSQAQDTAQGGGIPGYSTFTSIISSLFGWIPNSIDKGISALNPISWFQSLGAHIASGIEAGFVYLLKDLWSVIVGPLEIIAGTLLALAMIAFIFRNQLAEIAGIAAKAALA